jgi:penicillin-binding protein 2
LLADNRPVFSIALVPERVDDIDETLVQVSQIIDITPDQVERFHKRMKRSRRPFKAVTLKSKLSEEEIARIEVRGHEMPGVEVQAELARYYPLAGATAHSIGYVGRINEKELERVDEKNYSATNYIGKLGVERFYENELHGQVGFQTVETNAANRVLRVLERIDPVPGRDITLHMDARLQQKGIELLGDRRGAVVAMEPSTGGILALVSTPSFDPNLFVTGIDVKSYSSYRDSIDLPLFNRALKGQYPPGSTIKPIIGLGGLDSKTTTPQFSIMDFGKYQLKNDERIYRDWKREGHGRVNLKTAIAESCDTYFYDLAFKMGVDDMSRYLGYFGFGENTSLDISEARSGILPSRDWKRAIKGRAWYPGDSLNLGIGQGFMLATPLQLATATSVLANRGRWVTPAMLKAITDGEGVVRVREVVMDNVPVDGEGMWDSVLDSMVEVMHGKKGTARGSGRNAGYVMAGKTGTAQVVGIKQGEEYDAEALAERHRDHALFVGFAPAEDPQIVVAVIVENGGGGSTSAAPIARKMFDEWLVNLPAENNAKLVSMNHNKETLN